MDNNNTISTVRRPRHSEAPASDSQSRYCSTVLPPPHRYRVQKLGIHHLPTDPAAPPAGELAPVSFVTAKRPRTAWYSVYCFITIILLPDQNLRPARRSPTLSQRRQPLVRCPVSTFAAFHLSEEATSSSTQPVRVTSQSLCCTRAIWQPCTRHRNQAGDHPGSVPALSRLRPPAWANAAAPRSQREQYAYSPIHRRRTPQKPLTTPVCAQCVVRTKKALAAL